jgi:hypothetical protein
MRDVKVVLNLCVDHSNHSCYQRCFHFPNLFSISFLDVNHIVSNKVSQQPIQDKMVASVPIANFHMTPTTNVIPFSVSTQHPNQQSQVPKEG